MIDYLLVFIALIWCIFASISDIKTREVANWLNYSLVSVGFGLRFIYSLFNNEWSFFLYGVGGFIICFIVANIMYYGKQFGGGDAKLLMGLGIIFGGYPNSLLNYFRPTLNMPFIIILLINILIVGALYSLALTVILAIKNKNKFLENYKKIYYGKKFKIIKILTILTSFILFLMSFLFSDVNLKIIIILLAIFLLFLLHVFVFVKAVENSSMFKLVDAKKLTEGDWIVKPIYFKGKKIYEPERLGLTKENLNKLRKLKIKVLVKEGLPFVPVFLIALIISLIFGNIFFKLFSPLS